MASTDNEDDYVSNYTRAQAIADGTLIDVTATAREAGFKVPVALTRAAWDLCVALSPAAKKACNDEAGRLWDILWMLRTAAARASTSEVQFAVLCVTKRVRPGLVRLRSVIAGDDDGKPAITVMLSDES